MNHISHLIREAIGFKLNNCLLNYYENGASRMGFHGDTIKMLEPDTGIAIVSVGDRLNGYSNGLLFSFKSLRQSQ